MMQTATMSEHSDNGTPATSPIASDNTTARLRAIAKAIEVFKTPAGDAYGRVKYGNGYQTHPLKSKFIRGYLTTVFDDLYGFGPNPSAVENVLNVLEGRAYVSPATEQVYVHVAPHDDDLYLDLCDEAWRAVQLTPDGWDVTTDVPVNFRRPNGALKLPTPQRGGSIDALRDLINVETDNDWRLIVAWLLGTLHPRGPYPLLAFIAEQGSAKSTTSRFLRGLIDPSSNMLSKPPRDSDSLMLKANNNWVLAFDNMGEIPSWLSNDLCRLSTGGGDSKKRLYTDSDEVIYDARRPVILTGIGDLVTQPDLMERTLIVNLPRIGDGGRKRRDEDELNKMYEEAKPQILGALLDAASVALRTYRTENLPRTPRMADFAKWVTAAEPALGWTRHTFVNDYAANLDDANSLAIEASPVARAVTDFMRRVPNGTWTGTANELLTALKDIAGDDTLKHRDWPKDATRLSGKLRAVAPALRKAGTDLSFEHSGQRRITLRPIDTSRQGGEIKQQKEIQQQQKEIPQRGEMDALDAGMQRPDNFLTDGKESKENGSQRKAASAASAASAAPCCECGVVYRHKRLTDVDGDLLCDACYDKIVNGVDPRQWFTADDADCKDEKAHRRHWHLYRDDADEDDADERGYTAVCELCTPF